MRDSALLCWKCGTPLGDEPLPLGRLAECRACGAQLHICRMCRFYDTAAANACRETVAEAVTDKQRANFCGYFQPSQNAWQVSANPAAARDALNALFGASDDVKEQPRNPLDDLFGKS